MKKNVQEKSVSLSKIKKYVSFYQANQKCYVIKQTTNPRPSNEGDAMQWSAVKSPKNFIYFVEAP